MPPKDPKADKDCPTCKGSGLKCVFYSGEYDEELMWVPCHCVRRDDGDR